MGYGYPTWWWYVDSGIFINSHMVGWKTNQLGGYHGDINEYNDVWCVSLCQQQYDIEECLKMRDTVLPWYSASKFVHWEYIGRSFSIALFADTVFSDKPIYATFKLAVLCSTACMFDHTPCRNVPYNTHWPSEHVQMVQYNGITIYNNIWIVSSTMVIPLKISTDPVSSEDQPAAYGYSVCRTYAYDQSKTWFFWQVTSSQEIRPHRFGGEGVLIGGQNSNTKCSMTFVNIAVAISALAGGGGPKNGFAPRPEYGGVFDIFRGFLGVWAQEGIEMEFWVILVAFRQWKNGQKWKKTLYIARICRVFGCQSIENTAKTSVLDWRYSKKRVNYRMLDWKHYKNTVKSNVLEGFTAFMAKNV